MVPIALDQTQLHMNFEVICVILKTMRLVYLLGFAVYKKKTDQQ
jgi:hypothetical protein